MSTEELGRLAAEAGLDDVADELAALAQWGIRLECSGSERGVATPRSRLGGLPDLPPATPWPYAEPPLREAGLPMVFVAQIALEDLRQFSQWPAQDEGLLSFFIAGESDILYVEDPGGARVLYTSSGEELVPTYPPADMEAPVLGEVPLNARDELTIPGFTYFPSSVLVPLGFEPEIELEGPQARLRDRYHELKDRLERAQDAKEPRHRLLGHPTPVNEDVLDAAAQTGLRGRLNRFPSERERREAAPRWRLLLQVDDQDERLGITWGHSGSAYFCLPEEDLARGRYDRVEVVVQSS